MFKYLIGRRFDDGQEVYNMIRADSREEKDKDINEVIDWIKDLKQHFGVEQ